MHHLALASIYPSLISFIRWGPTLPSSCWPSPVWTVWRTSWTRPRMILEFLTMEESPSPTALTQTLGTSLCVCMCGINYTLSLMWEHCSLSLSLSLSLPLPQILVSDGIQWFTCCLVLVHVLLSEKGCGQKESFLQIQSLCKEPKCRCTFMYTFTLIWLLLYSGKSSGDPIFSRTIDKRRKLNLQDKLDCTVHNGHECAHPWKFNPWDGKDRLYQWKLNPLKISPLYGTVYVHDVYTVLH